MMVTHEYSAICIIYSFIHIINKAFFDKSIQYNKEKGGI
jgi:hypothetical protein